MFLVSCGSRKVAIQDNDTVTKTNTTSSVKKEETTSTQNNISINTDTDEVEITPIDSTKPIAIGDKKYYNAKIRYKKTKTVLVDTTKTLVSKKEAQVVNIIKKKNEKVFKKDIDKKESHSIYWWWLFIILLVLFIFYVYRKLNKTLL
jgi:acetyl-CoA carboxylase beta subunit